MANLDSLIEDLVIVSGTGLTANVRLGDGSGQRLALGNGALLTCEPRAELAAPAGLAHRLALKPRTKAERFFMDNLRERNRTGPEVKASES